MAKYEGKVFTEKEEMYSCYELAVLLNPRLSERDYRKTIDNIVDISNYKQYVVLYGGKPVSMVATQDILLMKIAPQKAAKINNIATLPEHRGAVSQFLIAAVEEDLKNANYGSVDINSSKDNLRAAKFYKKSGFENKDNFSWRKFINQDVEHRSRL